MPRKARIDAPGALHHIIIRGIERNPIFKDSQDYSKFLTRLGNILAETTISCYAWALIPNHIHLLLRTCVTPITSLMWRLLISGAAIARKLNFTPSAVSKLAAKGRKDILAPMIKTQLFVSVR